MTNNNKSLITPDIKIHEMLEAYPHLEDKLIEIAPVFAELKNPALKNTIAKVTTLKQASVVGGVSVGTLINRLRMAVNQGETEPPADMNIENSKPQWITKEKVVTEYDAREDIENNVHPVNRVIKETSEMEGDSVYLLISPFAPAPLIDMLADKKFDVYSEEQSPGCFYTYIKKQNPS
jgi:hypothetical protein